MKQDLIEWLSGRSGEPEGTGLFLAPLGASFVAPAVPERQPEPETRAAVPEPVPVPPAPEPVKPAPAPLSPQPVEPRPAEPDSEDPRQAEPFEPELEPEAEPEPQPSPLTPPSPPEIEEEADFPDTDPFFPSDEPAEEPDDERGEEGEDYVTEDAVRPKPRPLGSSGEYDSMPDLWPPAEGWEGLRFEDYEVQRGTLVTQKLHNDMRQRKTQAEELRESEPKPQKRGLSVLGMCLVLLLLLGLAGAFLALRRFLPLLPLGNGAEPPLTVLAAPVQTAPVTPEPAAPEPKPKPEPEPRALPPLTPSANFSLENELQKGTTALNQGRYDDAILCFYQLLSPQGQRASDARPWLGLAGAYRAKGMNFDAVRVLQEADGRFPGNLTVRETLRQLRQQRH